MPTADDLYELLIAAERHDDWVFPILDESDTQEKQDSKLKASKLLVVYGLFEQLNERSVRLTGQGHDALAVIAYEGGWETFKSKIPKRLASRFKHALKFSTQRMSANILSQM